MIVNVASVETQPTIIDIDFALIKGVLGGVWFALWAFWPLWVLVIIAAVLRLGLDRLAEEIRHVARRLFLRHKFSKGERWRTDRELLLWLRAMTPTEFEEYIAALFAKLGYSTRAIGGAYDGGIDVVAEKDGITCYIQCKKFITREVGVGAMRDFYGALADHLANGQAYFITTNKFTLEARRFAEDKPIELIDGYRLIEYIRQTQSAPEATPALTAMPAAPLPTPTLCACGGVLLEKRGKFGRFLGCSNYPTCRHTQDLAA